jgi:cysteine/O-acetylserine efflux protein
MMTTNLFSLISFVLISTFTPGPSNISSASIAFLHGYKKTLKYQIGLAFGVFLLMLLSGWLSTTLLHIFPAFEPIMRYIGAGYILYLAFAILKASYAFTETGPKPLGLMHGFILQILNPKLIVYAFTLFSAFLAPMAQNTAFLTFMAFVLAAISFCATSLWAFFGTGIKTRLRNPRLNIVINLVLSLLLVYTAISLTGII